MSARYYVLAPNRMHGPRSLWRIDDSGHDLDQTLMYDAGEAREFFADVVGALRQSGQCEPTDRTPDPC